MRYDFNTAHTRVGMEAAKWDAIGYAPAPGVVPLSVADMELLSPPEIMAAGMVATATGGRDIGQHPAVQDEHMHGELVESGLHQAGPAGRPPGRYNSRWWSCPCP